MVLVCNVISQGTRLKGYVLLYQEAHQRKLQSCQIWWP